MPDESVKKEIEILSKKELDRTIKRLASQILEKIPNINSLLLIGIPTRGVYLSKILAKCKGPESTNMPKLIFEISAIKL